VRAAHSRDGCVTFWPPDFANRITPPIPLRSATAVELSQGRDPMGVQRLVADESRAVRECRQALDCGGSTPLWLCGGQMDGLRKASSGRKTLRLASKATVTLRVKPEARQKRRQAARTPKAGATLEPQFAHPLDSLSITPLSQAHRNIRGRHRCPCHADLPSAGGAARRHFAGHLRGGHCRSSASYDLSRLIASKQDAAVGVA